MDVQTHILVKQEMEDVQALVKQKMDKGLERGGLRAALMHIFHVDTGAEDILELLAFFIGPEWMVLVRSMSGWIPWVPAGPALNEHAR